RCPSGRCSRFGRCHPHHEHPDRHSLRASRSPYPRQLRLSPSMLVRTRTDRPVRESQPEPSVFRTYAKMLWRDKLAFASAIFILMAVLAAIAAPIFLEHQATAMNLLMRNAAPFDLNDGLWYILGGDTLGRSVLARILVAARNTLLVAASAVFAS